MTKSKAHAALFAGATLWCLIIVVAPLTSASAVYAVFSIICHQDPARSWHMAGEPLPVCIRRASIYFAFFVSLWLNLPGDVRWLRFAIAILAVEFVFARFVADVAAVRAMTGLIFGAAAAPFVKRGVGELSESL